MLIMNEIQLPWAWGSLYSLGNINRRVNASLKIAKLASGVEKLDANAPKKSSREPIENIKEKPQEEKPEEKTEKSREKQAFICTP